MKLRIAAASVAAWLLVAPSPCSAQFPSYELTFNVPLNVTQLSADITKIAVSCSVQSTAIITNVRGEIVSQQEFLVKGGFVIDAARVVILASGLDNPIGKSARYTCILKGFSAPLNRWDIFSETATIAAFRVTPTPVPLDGNFTWWQ